MVTVRYTKYDGSPHWSFEGELLGEDEHGVWIGGRRGTVLSRPGLTIELATEAVQVFPRTHGWTATFNARNDADPRARVETYVDASTVPTWSTDGGEVTLVDLDLDVVQLFDGTLYVDDEDEFAEHRVRFGYPPEIVALAERSTREVVAAIRDGAEPFGSVWRSWLDRLAH